MIAALLLPLVTTSGQVEAPRVPITIATISNPEDITEPIIDYICRAETVDGKKIQFTIRYAGGRGYQDSSTKEIKMTGATASFSGRDGGLFESYEITAWRHRIDGLSKNAKAFFGQWISVHFERTELPYQAKEPYRVGVLVKFESMPQLLKAIGYCDQKFTAQRPLSSAEVKELVKQ